MRLLFSLFLTVIAGTHILAQNADSLRQVLKAADSNDDKVSALLELYQVVKADSVSEAGKYARRALVLAEGLEGNLKARVYTTMGAAYYDSRIIDSSQYCYDQALKLYRGFGDSVQVARTIADIGLNHYSLNQYINYCCNLLKRFIVEDTGCGYC